MQLKLYGERHLAQQLPFKVGAIVYEANGSHNIPARVIEVIDYHGRPHYKIHFKNKSILQKQILADYRLSIGKNEI